MDKKGKKKGEGKGKKGDRARSPSASVQKTGSGLEWLEVNGRKVSYCCMAYKNEGKCGFEAKHGKPCAFKHYSKGEYDSLCQQLATELA